MTNKPDDFLLTGQAPMGYGTQEINMELMILASLATAAQTKPHPAENCPRCMNSVCCCVIASECFEDAKQPETGACASIAKNVSGFFCGLAGLPSCLLSTACCCGCCNSVKPMDRVEEGYLPPSARAMLRG